MKRLNMLKKHTYYKENVKLSPCIINQASCYEDVSGIGGKLTGSRPGCLNPGEEVPITHCTGGCVDNSWSERYGEKNLLLLPEIESRPFGQKAIAVLTELFLLQYTNPSDSKPLQLTNYIEHSSA
jgi:hypothetical protein